MDKRKIILLFISLGFIVLFVIFLLNLKSKAPVFTPPIGPQPSPTPIPWQSYLNQDYEYRLSYPPNWQVEAWNIKEAAKLTRIPDGSIWHQAKFKGESGVFEVLIWENQSQAPLRSWLSWFRHEDLNLSELPEEENFQIGGMPAILYSQAETGRGPLDHIFFQQDNKIYEFVEEKEAAFTVDYNKVITSFVFLEDEIAIEPKAENLVSQAKENLSQKLDVNKDEIRLTQIEPVDWPDTSLGCSSPGMLYAQVITSGYKITLEGRGKSYIYHSDFKRVVSCEK
ncbi:hypothetical protein ISS85_05530 [Candidatus Microgenomates bacterium]|nr:hypothetical protein [Candidatus Microgenomates bacterium]